MLKLDYRNAETTTHFKQDRLEHTFVRIFFITFVPPVHSCLEASPVCYNTPYRIQHNVSAKSVHRLLTFQSYSIFGYIKERRGSLKMKTQFKTEQADSKNLLT